MLRSQGIEADWIQLTQGLESLFQGRKVQVSLEGIMVFLCMRLKHLQLGKGPESSHKVIGCVVGVRVGDLARKRSV